MSFDNKKLEDEIDFKNVLSNPVRWFGLIYPLFLVIIVLLGLFYLTQIDNIEKNRIEPAIFDSVKTFKEIPVSKGKSVKGIDLALVKHPSMEMLEKAKGIYTSVCSTCHGAKGNGDGPAGDVLTPKPRNFHRVDGWINGRKFSNIYRTINEGIPGTGMTGYDYIETDVKIALVHYIRQFSNNFPKLTDKEITDLNAKYKLSEGSVTPNTISISKAMSVLEKENSTIVFEVDDVLAKVKADKSEPAEILKKNVKCLKKALVFLSKNNQWKQNPDVFSTIVFNTAQTNGFYPSIVRLPKDKFDLVYNYLKSYI